MRSCGSSKRPAARPCSTSTRGSWVVPLLDPEAVKLALDEVTAAAGVDVLLQATLAGAQRDGEQLTAVDYLDFGGARRSAAGRAFVDATGDSVLSALGGALIADQPGRSRADLIGAARRELTGQGALLSR